MIAPVASPSCLWAAAALSKTNNQPQEPKFDGQSHVDAPVAFHRVVVDLGQAVRRPSHHLVQLWVPQAADDTLEKKRKEKKKNMIVF